MMSEVIDMSKVHIVRGDLLASDCTVIARQANCMGVILECLKSTGRLAPAGLDSLATCGSHVARVYLFL